MSEETGTPGRTEMQAYKLDPVNTSAPTANHKEIEKQYNAELLISQEDLITDVAANTADIATNVTNIGTNAGGIATNVTNIGTNAGGIATNVTNIGANTTNIGTNAGGIATNVTNIAARLIKTNNLSDLADAATALANLGISADELAAIVGAAAPASGNVFATMADIPSAAIVKRVAKSVNSATTDETRYSVGFNNWQSTSWRLDLNIQAGFIDAGLDYGKFDVRFTDGSAIIGATPKMVGVAHLGQDPDTGADNDMDGYESVQSTSGFSGNPTTSIITSANYDDYVLEIEVEYDTATGIDFIVRVVDGVSKNRKFTFGFLNTAQDPVDLKNAEASELSSIDADELALGKLISSDYLSVTPTPPPFNSAVLGGRDFRIALTLSTPGSPATAGQPGYLEFEENSGSGDYLPVNIYDIGTPNPNTSYPPKADAPSIIAVNNENVATDAGDIETTDTTTDEMEVQVKPSTTISLTLPTRTYIIKITEPTPAVFHWECRYSTDPTTTVRATGGPIIDNTTFFDVLDNLQIRFPTIGALATEWAAALDDTGNYTVSQPSLTDGTYTYLQVAVKNTSIDPVQDVEGLASASATLEIKNFNDLGVRVDSVQPSTEYPTATFAYTYVDEVWLYRKGIDDDEFIRVHVFESGGSSPANDFDDNSLASELVSLRVLKSADDNGFPELNGAIGNTSLTFDKIFEKDNRIWALPTDRKDLLIYSRQSDWWGWPRANAFSFEGDIVDITFTRDPTTVGGEFTMVVFTTNGIFHITGNGSQDKPYVLFPAIRNITVEQNSVVDMNGVIMFMTSSTTGDYDDGAYGQKIYEYNLQNVTEVSARVKTTPLITSTAGIQFAEMIGSDKYIIKKTGVDETLLYHRDVQGWVEVDATIEATGAWTWTSKQLTPNVMDRFNMSYARKFKVDIQGSIEFRFIVLGEGTNGIQKTITLTPSGFLRQEFIQRLPSLKGRKWQLVITAKSVGAVLYDFYFVI